MGAEVEVRRDGENRRSFSFGIQQVGGPWHPYEGHFAHKRELVFQSGVSDMVSPAVGDCVDDKRPQVGRDESDELLHGVLAGSEGRSR